VGSKAQVSAAVLAGGESLRLGQDKAFLKWGEQTLLGHLLTKLDPLFPELLVSVKDTRKFQQIHPCGRLVVDAISGQGSLVGIYSALSAASYPYLFVLACDMPLADAMVIHRLIDDRLDYDAVIPQTAGGLEPLCAVYSRRCLEPIRRQMQRNDFKASNLLHGVKTKIVRVSEEEEKSFLNINTPADYEIRRKAVLASPSA